MDIFTKVGCFYEAWMFLRSMDIFTKHESFSLRSMKRREGVFSPKAQKRYVYKSFMHRKEMNYKKLHIKFEDVHTEYYSFVTTRLH
jgi:hypothetical protein